MRAYHRRIKSEKASKKSSHALRVFIVQSLLNHPELKIRDERVWPNWCYILISV